MRANVKLLTMATIAPTQVSYAHISQKILKAAAGRMFLFWISMVVYDAATKDPSLHNMSFGCRTSLEKVCFGHIQGSQTNKAPGQRVLGAYHDICLFGTGRDSWLHVSFACELPGQSGICLRKYPSQAAVAEIQQGYLMFRKSYS